MNPSGRIETLSMAGAAIVVILLFAVSYLGGNRAHSDFKPGEFVSAAGHRQKFVIYQPQGRVVPGKLPLVVFLNGIESIGHDGRQQLKNRLAFSLYQRVREARSVQCIALFPQSKRPWSSSELDRDTLCELVDEVCRVNDADATRILLVGAADGARGAVKLSVKHPHRWMGAVLFSSAASPFSGRLPSDFRITWYQDPPSISSFGTCPDPEFLQQQYGGIIQWVDWGGVSSNDLWSMPGFSQWLSTP